MEAKLCHPACPGLSTSEQHLRTKAQTGPKCREARSRSPRKHLREQRGTIITLLNNNNKNLNLAGNRGHEI